MKRLLSSFFLTALLSTLTLPALAATMQAGENVKLTGPILDNAYMVGSKVTVDQSIKGDLVTAAGNILVQSRVEEDILAAGGTVFIDSNVGGDVRVVGGTLVIGGTIGGDLMAAGGNITLLDGASVGGDVVMGGGDMNLGGTIGGNVTIRGGNVSMGSQVKGNVDIRADQLTITGTVDGTSLLAATTISVAPAAKLMRDVRYWSELKEQQFASGQSQIHGKATFDPSLAILQNLQENSGRAAGAAMITAVIGAGGFLLLSATLLILLLALLTQTFFTDAAKFLQKRPWTSFLYGFLFFAATPVAALLFFISIIGIPIAFFIGSLYLFAILFAKPVAAIALARTLELKRGAKWGKPMVILMSALLYLALKIISLVPVVGWMICLVVVLFGVGSVVETTWTKWSKIR